MSSKLRLDLPIGSFQRLGTGVNQKSLGGEKTERLTSLELTLFSRQRGVNGGLGGQLIRLVKHMNTGIPNVALFKEQGFLESFG